MKSKKILIIILTLATILSIVLPALVFADENKDKIITLTAEERHQIVQSLQDNGVNNKTINNLIIKLEKGIVWDSFKEEYKDIEPASITESDGTITKKYVYPDGSIKLISVVAPPTNESEIDALATVSGGTWVSGTGYRTCFGAYVSYNLIIVHGSFYADFTLVDDYYDYISKVYDPEAGVTLGTLSDITLSITRATETSYQPAEARLQFYVTNLGGSCLSWLSLSVGNDQYYADNN